MHNNKMGDDIVVGSRKLRKLMVLKKKDPIFTSQFDATDLSPLVSSSPSLSFTDSDSTPSSKISPAVVFIIVILAAVLFISGLIHLLIRFLIKHRPSSSSVSESNTYPDLSRSNNVQRQLQQLFHLHDSGLDQAFIDALPVFLYQEIMGLKEPFDCAVCLCEFSEQDKLRLLPDCSHAFHIDCIDTWLLSNSTCPLCRGTLFTHGIYTETPIFALEGSREDEDGFYEPMENDIGKRVFSVRLGKFKSSNESENGKGGEETSEAGETSSSNFDARRCISMGSYQYVVADSDLQVALRPVGGSASMRIVKEQGSDDSEGKSINFRSKGESFSVSKIWQWSRKGRLLTSSETHLGNGGNNSCITVDPPWKDRNKGT